MRKIILVTVAALFVSSCAAFSQIQNPFTNNQLATVESSYGIALSAAVAYRNTRLCKRNEIATVTNICAYRFVILKLQAADRQVQKALKTARTFIKNNPTLDASDAINGVRTAIAAFQSLQAEYGVTK